MRYPAHAWESTRTPGPPGADVDLEAARGGGERPVGVLGVDAALDGVALQLDVVLLATASGSPAATRICALTRSMPVSISVTGCSTWMRALTSMKWNSLPCEQELDGAGAVVADLLGEPHGRAAHLLAQVGGQRRARPLLDHLLVAALDRAVALAEVDDLAVACRRGSGSRRGAAPPGTSRGRRSRRRRPPRPRVCAAIMLLTSEMSLWATRIPRPPPPETALMRTG